MSTSNGNPGFADHHIFVTKVIRDLHWALASPHVLSSSACAVVDDQWCAELVAKSLPWLRDLDADPTPVENWLRAQRNVRRLGFYFAALLEFWVRHCPLLALHSGSAGTDSATSDSAGTVSAGAGAKQLPVRQVLAQQQIHAGIDGQCAGQLKLVFERSCTRPKSRLPSSEGAVADAADAADAAEPADAALATEFAHWESHVKFFAHCGEDTALIDDGDESCNDVSEADVSLATYVGPFLGENLLHRVVELRRKLALSEAPAVRHFLGSHFGRASEPTVKPESVVRG